VFGACRRLQIEGYRPLVNVAATVSEVLPAAQPETSTGSTMLPVEGGGRLRKGAPRRVQRQARRLAGRVPLAQWRGRDRAPGGRERQPRGADPHARTAQDATQTAWHRQLLLACIAGSPACRSAACRPGPTSHAVRADVTFEEVGPVGLHLDQQKVFALQRHWVPSGCNSTMTAYSPKSSTKALLQPAVECG
jgi:hypothetical protein